MNRETKIGNQKFIQPSKSRSQKTIAEPTAIEIAITQSSTTPNNEKQEHLAPHLTIFTY